MTKHAKGNFDVTLTANPPYDTAPGATLGRASISKQFHGDLEASSSGEMLSARTERPDSAGYVAMERVVGTLHGRTGSFVFQHSGTVTRGKQALSVTVVPDSGTAELKGIAGEMTITILNGAHSYEFAYTLA
jgi:hypothetical protein